MRFKKRCFIVAWKHESSLPMVDVQYETDTRILFIFVNKSLVRVGTWTCDVWFSSPSFILLRYRYYYYIYWKMFKWYISWLIVLENWLISKYITISLELIEISRLVFDSTGVLRHELKRRRGRAKQIRVCKPLFLNNYESGSRKLFTNTTIIK